MTPASFIAWRARLSLDKKAAAAALGCTRNFIYSMESGRTKIPRYVALACAAIEAGLPAIGEKTAEQWRDEAIAFALKSGFRNVKPPSGP